MGIVKVYFFDNNTAHKKMLKQIESFFKVEFIDDNEKFSVAIDKNKSFMLNYNKYNLNFILPDSYLLFDEVKLVKAIEIFLNEANININAFYIEEPEKEMVLN